ncbi:MAG: pyridoxamine kinase, partial [Oscillospiraceae bacterium]|nr:pyridoxamine kinase [Oscillospiraceae bacterium]
MQPIKRVAAIHDLSGYGRCSLSVVYPVLSVMGLQCCALPTAFLSTHTGYDGFTFHDMTDALRPAAAHWRARDFRFDALYSGFLGSVEQIGIVREIFAAFRRPGTLALVDPVMGDNGRPYRTYTPDMCARMGALADDADIITPNLTEAALLLDEPWAAAPGDETGVTAWVDRLSRGGTRSVVLTGVTCRPGLIGSAYFDRDTGGRDILFYPFVGLAYHGTGDLYAAVLLGALLHGQPLADAVALAGGFVRDCAALAQQENASREEGVRYEALLYRLG